MQEQKREGTKSIVEIKSQLLPYYCQPCAETTENLLRTTTYNLLNTQQRTNTFSTGTNTIFSGGIQSQLGK